MYFSFSCDIIHRIEFHYAAYVTPYGDGYDDQHEQYSPYHRYPRRYVTLVQISVGHINHHLIEQDGYRGRYQDTYYSGSSFTMLPSNRLIMRLAYDAS